MITINIKGGLGNQLFQIFTLIAYSITNNIVFVLPNYKQLGFAQNGTTVRYTYWDTFFSELQRHVVPINNIKQIPIIKEKSFKYQSIPFYSHNIFMLDGYFQSYKYFDDNKQLIFNIIKLNNKKNVLKQKIETNMSMNINELTNVVSMHFRFGDYKKYPDMYPLMTEIYYINALKYMKSQNKSIKKVLYFCQDEDLTEVTNIINILSYKFPTITFERICNNLCDWEQLLLMSICKYNIIANSTFSWWGAYFNEYNDKIVCYPKDWFIQKKTMDVSTMHPTDWIEISNITLQDSIY